MKQWYKNNGFPPEDVTRFFIGTDYTGKRAFGIFEENGVFTVYKNKDDGTRAVRYCGPDEAHAVKELYERLLQEVDNQRMHGHDVVPNVATHATPSLFSDKKPAAQQTQTWHEYKGTTLESLKREYGASEHNVFIGEDSNVSQAMGIYEKGGIFYVYQNAFDGHHWDLKTFKTEGDAAAYLRSLIGRKEKAEAESEKRNLAYREEQLREILLFLLVALLIFLQLKFHILKCDSYSDNDDSNYGSYSDSGYDSGWDSGDTDFGSDW